MSDLVARFEREHLQYHRVSKTRAREVVGHLRALEVLAGVPAQDAPVDALRAYITGLSADRAGSTVAKIIGQIRPFYQWAWEHSLIDAQRLMEIKTVKPPRGARGGGVPRPYSRDEIRKLWADWDRDYALPKTQPDIERALWFVQRWENGTSRWPKVRPLAWRFQSRAIISLAMSGGLRRDEIYRLSVNDMHYESAYVVVTGARKNAAAEPVKRIVPWTTPEMREAIRDWLDLRDRIVPGHDFPWLSMASTPHIRTRLPHRTYEMLMTTLGRGWEFHRLRHTAATEMLRAGYPLETVQKVMGHSRLEQTLAYAQLLTDDVIRVAGKCEMQLSTALAFVEAA